MCGVQMNAVFVILPPEINHRHRMSEDNFQDEYGILTGMAAGSSTAFAALHRRYWNDIYSLALSFLKSPHAAEDIVQEVFVKLWLRRETLPEVREFRPYAMVMARNEIISAMRKDAVRQKRHDRFLTELGPSIPPAPGRPFRKRSAWSGKRWKHYRKNNARYLPSAGKRDYRTT